MVERFCRQCPLVIAERGIQPADGLTDPQFEIGRDLVVARAPGVDRSLAAARGDDAMRVWNGLCERRLLPYAAGGPGMLANGDFARPILNRGFDWILPASSPERMPCCANISAWALDAAMSWA